MTMRGRSALHQRSRSRISRAACHACTLLAIVTWAEGCTGEPAIQAPAPTVLADDSSAVAPLPSSVVESEIRYDLQPALVALEKSVPRAFGDMQEHLPVPGNSRAHFSFAATRGPFSISVDSERVTVSAVIEYEGRGYYKPFIGPEVSAACGTGGVPRPRARIRMESTIALKENWSLSAKSRLTRVAAYSAEPRDKCTVTLFHIDVTEKVMKATRAQLEKQLKTLDAALASVNTKKRFEQWWRSIERPIRLADSVYFTINPQSVQLGSIQVDSGFAIAHLRLEAVPRIKTGYRPNDFDLFTELPPLKSGKVHGKGLRVTLEAEFGYDIANALLERALVGKKVDVGDRRFQINEVALSGIGAGRVALRIRFDGSAKGIVYFVGTPVYDNAADQLAVPDLSYDLNTSSLLVRGVAFLGDKRIVNYLRDKARFPIEGQLDRLRTLAASGMNRQLSEGVSLISTLDRAENVSVRATIKSLRVRADAGGAIRLDIARPLTAKKMSAGKRRPPP